MKCHLSFVLRPLSFVLNSFVLIPGLRVHRVLPDECGG